MKSLLIDVNAHEVRPMTLSDNEHAAFDRIRQCIGCRALALGAVLPNGDIVYVNQNGVFDSVLYFKHPFIRIPLPGNAVLVGSTVGGDLADVKSDWTGIQAGIYFMDKWDALEWALREQQCRESSGVAA